MTEARLEKKLEAKSQCVGDHVGISTISTGGSLEILTAAPCNGLPNAAMELTSSVQDSINLALVEELRVLRLDRLELDRNFFARGCIRSKINVSERTASNLSPKAVLPSYTQLHDASQALCLSKSCKMAPGEMPLSLCCRLCAAPVTTLCGFIVLPDRSTCMYIRPCVYLLYYTVQYYGTLLRVCRGVSKNNRKR